MCGIAGYSGRVSPEVSQRILDVLAHRGPDGNGCFVSDCGAVTLLHTRLAIQDPTPVGAQPMSAAGGRVVISFNGEIYNFKKLRADLEKNGYVFQTGTDTEVLLALYLEYGSALLGYLNGIFSFAIWDARSSTLLLARDGMGVKPLYICESGGAISFASEIKALLCFPWINRDLDPQALALYIRHLWCPAPRTPLLDVKKVLPGEAIIILSGRIVRRWQYYGLPLSRPDRVTPVTKLAKRVRDGLGKAVDRQMVADVEVGAFLSGGLDSSSIVAFARRHTRKRLQCFTIDFDARMARRDGYVRDLPYAERVAKHLDVNLNVITVGSELADNLERMVWQLDEPQADFSALSVMFISQLARQQGIKVLLSGAGGDDLFTGYRRHRALALGGIWDRMPALIRQSLAKLGRSLPARPILFRQLSKLLAAGGLDGNERLVSYFDWMSPAEVDSLFLPELKITSESPLLAALDGMDDDVTLLQRMLLLEQKYFLVDHNLNYTDKMSMAAGVETRVPFLDSDLMELAAQIPDEYRQRGGEGKWILKKAMEGILPNDIIYRPKTGFGVPLRTWIDGPLRPLVHELLSDTVVRDRGIFRPEKIAGMLSDNENGIADNAYSIFSAMCIELWCRQFAVSSDKEVAIAL